MLAAALGLLLLAPASAAALEVRFPFTVDHEILRAALRKHLHEHGGQLDLWRTADGCGSFALRDPLLEHAEGRLRIAGPATAQAGFPFLWFCWANVAWDGHVEILTRPEIGPDWQLRLRDLDTRLLDDAGRQRGRIADRVWNVVKGWAEAELAAFTFDLGAPVAELRSLLGLFAGQGAAGPLLAALQTLRPAGVAVEPDAVTVTVALDVPPAPPTAPAPEPALTPAQVARWQAALERWDGFLVFAVKDLGVVQADAAARQELLDLLLAARHDLVDVLGRGPEPGVDPVRQLFLSVWQGLRPIVRRTAALPGDEGRALRYTLFLAAGDALAAVEAAAPAAGLEISADGLRRLARILDPESTGDPLEYSDILDPRLQQLFRFRDPDAPPRRTRPRPPRSWEWLGPRAAHAAEPDHEWVLLGRRLDRWVATAAEVPAYREAVARLLSLAAERSFDPDALDDRFDDLYHHLVKAVAWQESCWRQFTRKAGSVTYLASATGDVGIMQINARIWRGFFHPERLRWSAAYNAGAGAEILLHLLARYGVREGRERLENAARATYAAYNGGPSQYRRYRQAGAPAARRMVDRAFWAKYQAVAAGTAGDRVLCLPPGAAPS